MTVERLEPPGERFELLDALRGVAAVSVLVFHLFNNAPQADAVRGALSSWVMWLPDHARSGVACFFVISGFVIAYSTRNLGTRVQDAGRFALRRQVRLDPPYYVAVLAVLLLGAVQSLVPGLVSTSYSVTDIVLNLVYLQDLTGAPRILAVSWTLCLEVQFYLVVMLLMLLSSRRARGRETAGHSRVVRAGALTLGVASLAIPFLGWDLAAWFLPLWWMFCLGMLLCWCHTGSVSRGFTRAAMALVGLWCVLLQAAGHADPWGGEWTAWATGVLVLMFIETRRTASRAPAVLLYGGAVSYSLYLVHLPVIDTVLGAMYKVTGDDTAWAFVSLAVGAVACFVTAHVLLVLVERPAMQWARRLRRAHVNADPRT